MNYTVSYMKMSLLVCAKAGLHLKIWIRPAAYTPATQGRLVLKMAVPHLESIVVKT